jgi:hypothetical protein
MVGAAAASAFSRRIVSRRACSALWRSAASSATWGDASMIVALIASILPRTCLARVVAVRPSTPMFSPVRSAEESTGHISGSARSCLRTSKQTPRTGHRKDPTEPIQRRWASRKKPIADMRHRSVLTADATTFTISGASVIGPGCTTLASTAELTRPTGESSAQIWTEDSDNPAGTRAAVDLWPHASVRALNGPARGSLAQWALYVEATKPLRIQGFHSVGAPRFELGTSGPPDQRANQAAPRPVAGTP